MRQHTMVLIAAGAVLVAVLAGLLAGTWQKGIRRREHDRQDRLRASSPRWCRPAELGDMRVKDPAQLNPTRIYLGRLGPAHVANLPYRSVLVVAPTGAGKTPRVAVPMVLRHNGPLLATSIKADLVHLTRHHRAKQGPVWYFDITDSTGLANCCWSPLAGIETYGDALKAARWLTSCSKVEGQSTGDKEWWDQKGEALVAPALFAAAKTGRHISAVVNWIKTVADKQVDKILADLGDLDARASWVATMGREAKMKDSIYATAESILAPFGNPDVRARLTVDASSGLDVFTPARLLDEGGTLYLLGSIEDQAFYAPVFEALVNSVVREMHRRSHRLESAGLPPSKPLLLCIDEAANTAPLRELGGIASAGAGQGIVLATFWQDFSQIERIYGEIKAREIRSNHTSHLFLPGITDEETLRSLSTALGSHRVLQQSHSTEWASKARLLDPGHGSTSTQWTDEEIAPVSWLRQQKTGTAFCLTRSMKPMQLHLPGWWEDKGLEVRVDPEIAARVSGHYQRLTAS